MVQRQRLYELISQEIAPQKTVHVTSVDSPEDSSGARYLGGKACKGISKLQRNYLSVTSPARQLQGDLSYPSSYNSKQSNLSQAVRYLVDPFLTLSFALNT